MKQYGLEPTLTETDDIHGHVCGREGRGILDLIRIGRLTEYGRRLDVFMDVSSEKVIAIFGKRGQGKSYTLGSLIEGLVTEESNSSISRLGNRRAVLLFDTLNIYQWMNVPLDSDTSSEYPEIQKQARVLEGWDVKPEKLKVKIWFPAGFPSDFDPGRHNELLLRISDFSLEDWGLLLGLDTIRDIKGQLVAEVFMKVTNIGWDHHDGQHIPPNESYSVNDMLDCLENDADFQSGVYRNETLRAVRQQLLAFSRLPLFQGEGTALNELLEPGQVSVILLNRLSQDLRGVLVSVLIRRLLRERSAASEATKDLMVNPNLCEDNRQALLDFLKTAVPKTWVVVDEAQNVIPSERRTSASESLVKLVKEGRNFGLSFVVTTQQPKALDRSVMSQVETFIVHKLVSHNDIEYVFENIKCPFPEGVKEDIRVLSSRDLLRDIDRGQVVVSDTNSPRSFVMQVRPRVSVHGGFEA
ncbi:MAG: ATP-binding protein [Candidatus Hodarchaeota archaeon]